MTIGQVPSALQARRPSAQTAALEWLPRLVELLVELEIDAACDANP
jgi:hypothetical protein